MRCWCVQDETSKQLVAQDDPPTPSVAAGVQPWHTITNINCNLSEQPCSCCLALPVEGWRRVARSRDRRTKADWARVVKTDSLDEDYVDKERISLSRWTTVNTGIISGIAYTQVFRARLEARRQQVMPMLVAGDTLPTLQCYYGSPA